LSLPDLIKNLRKESEELAENYEEELHLENYMKFAEFVFDYIIKYDNQKNYFDVFAEFIHIMKYCFNKYEEKKDDEKESIDDAYKKIKEGLDKKFAGIEKININTNINK